MKLEYPQANPLSLAITGTIAGGFMYQVCISVKLIHPASESADPILCNYGSVDPIQVLIIR